MELPPAGKLLFHLARRWEGGQGSGGWALEGGSYVCAQLHSTLADVPFKWAEGGSLVSIHYFHHCSSTTNQKFGGKKIDDQGKKREKV
jgi:hypothetical protein